LSLGHDPDLIARYLAGEEVTEQLREIEGDEDTDYRRRPGADSARLAVVRIDGKRMERFHRIRAVPTAEQRKERPTLALIALAIALVVFAVSMWIALR